MDGLRGDSSPQHHKHSQSIQSLQGAGVGGRKAQTHQQKYETSTEAAAYRIVVQNEAIHSPWTTQIFSWKEPHGKRKNWPDGRRRNGVFGRWKYAFTSTCSENTRAGRQEMVIKP